MVRSLPLLTATSTLGRLPGVVHGFTTRIGGVSGGALASLNLALRAGETRERLSENWARAVSALHPSLSPEAVAVLSQVHGNRVVRVEAGLGPSEAVAEADASFTLRAGVVLAVRTADCVPVLIAGSAGAGGPEVVGVAHAGWRGTASRVVPLLIEAIAEAGVPAGALSAAVGPCISGAAYEVGHEVVDGLRASGLDDADFLEVGHGRPRVDLRRAVRAQLERAGVRQVEVSDRCTATDPDLYSHRRDGDATGRMAGLIARLP